MKIKCVWSCNMSQREKRIQFSEDFSGTHMWFCSSNQHDLMKGYSSGKVLVFQKEPSFYEIIYFRAP